MDRRTNRNNLSSLKFILVGCTVVVVTLNFLIKTDSNQSSPRMMQIEAKSVNGDDSSPYGLVIPVKSARALPSIRLSADENAAVDRKFYGGSGDKAHLGGFTNFDPMGVR